MREAIGGAGLFQIVIVLLLLFTAYLCLSINYTAAYKVTDSVINRIKKDNGVNPIEITKVLQEAHYTSKGKCATKNDTEWTAMSFDNKVMNDNGEANYCIKKILVSRATDELPEIYYYRVKTFYNVDVPLINLIDLNVKADSSNIYGANDVNVNLPVLNNKDV